MNLLWPYGKTAPDRQALAIDGNKTISVFDRLTVVDGTITAAATLVLSISAETPDGALLVLNLDQDATGRNITLGTGFVGNGVTGVANDKDTVLAIYNKSAGTFRVVSQYKTIDAA